jgi:uncharacterized damage-inducible protein DinB
MSIAQMLLPEFDEEMANTRKILERLPEDKPDFKPHEKSMPLKNLAGHVADMANWMKCALEVETLNWKASDAPCVMTSREELLAQFDRNVVGARALLEKATDEDFAKTWTFQYEGKTLFAQPRTTVVRNMVMNHLIHHRAQLGIYLRLNNIAVPGMYGPSADEANPWEQQASTA